MATLDAAALELAASLPIDAVPAKLRCGSCNKLAVNAVKLPCCDQTICEPCSQDLPETCPICSHSPLSSEDLKPNKSLRTTIKAFIKTEEKKRSKDVEIHALESLPTPTLGAEPVSNPEPESAKAVEAAVGSPTELNGGAVAHVVPIVEDSEGRVLSATADIVNDHDTQDVARAASGDINGDQEDEDEDDEDDVVITTERPENEVEQQAYPVVEEPEDQADAIQEKEQTNGQQGFGFDQSQNFGNMDFGNMNNFNPMMAMQGGMGMPNFMGMSNMMGMPGMNMDPSMMFGGSSGFGMGGMNDMGMNMMGMGMGMNGMGGFGGMPGMGNMGGGPGFFPPNGGGYNNQQQSYGNHMNQNFHHNRGYGRPYNRGFGRGRGNSYGRGRGGWQPYGQYNQGPNQNQGYMNQQYQQQQNFRGNDENLGTGAQQGATRGSPSYEPMNAPDGPAGDDSEQKRVTDAELADDTNSPDVVTTDQAGATAADIDGTNAESVVRVTNEDVSNDPNHVDSASAALETASAITATDHSGDRDSGNVNGDQTIAQDNQQAFAYDARGRGGSFGTRAGFGNRSGAYGTYSTPVDAEATPVAPPVNAPTGPKAMRQGLPNSGWYSRPQQQQAQAPAPPRPASSRGRDAEPEPESHARTHSKSRSKSRDRQRTERRKSRHDAEEESEDSYERRKDRERRKRKERDARYDEEKNGDESSGKNRSRSESRDADRSKRRHRDKDEERRSRRDRSRDRRKHRHRSRSPEKETSVNSDSRDSSRRKHKSERRRGEEQDESDRAKEKSSRHSRRDDGGRDEHKDRSNESSSRRKYIRDDREKDQSREMVQSAVVVEEPEEEFEFKIKGKSAASMKQGLDTSMGPPATFARDRSERRSSVQASTPVTPGTPSVDPYAAERESHRKQREAEQQKKMEGRRQSSQSLGKHSRGEEEPEVPTGPRGDGGRNGKRVRKDMRKHSLKYEGEVGDGYEERDTRRWR